VTPQSAYSTPEDRFYSSFSRTVNYASLPNSRSKKLFNSFEFLSTYLFTLKVVFKKIEPPYSLDLQGCKAVFINTFCPISLSL